MNLNQGCEKVLLVEEPRQPKLLDLKRILLAFFHKPLDKFNALNQI